MQCESHWAWRQCTYVLAKVLKIKNEKDKKETENIDDKNKNSTGYVTIVAEKGI